MSISTSQTPSGRTPEQDAVIAPHRLARATEAKETRQERPGPLRLPGRCNARKHTLRFRCERLISQIHEQKAIIAPDCAACPSPCGRTADFLPEDLNRTDDGLFEERNRLLKKASANRPGRNGHGSLPIRKIRKLQDSLWTACSWQDTRTKRNCLRRTLKNWKVTVHGHSIPAHCSGILPQ